MGRIHDCKRQLLHAQQDLLRGGGHPHMRRRDIGASRSGRGFNSGRSRAAAGPTGTTDRVSRRRNRRCSSARRLSARSARGWVGPASPRRQQALLLLSRRCVAEQTRILFRCGLVAAGAFTPTGGAAACRTTAGVLSALAPTMDVAHTGGITIADNTIHIGVTGRLTAQSETNHL